MYRSDRRNPKQHPVRARIVESIGSRGPMGLRELADALELPVARIGYHVKVLESDRELELVAPSTTRKTPSKLYATR